MLHRYSNGFVYQLKTSTNVKNIKEGKSSTYWLALIVIVKLWTLVLLNLKSHIITHPWVTNDDVPSKT